MPIYDITRDDIETFTVVTNPQRTFTTGVLGTTGSVFVRARRSAREKDIAASASSVSAAVDDAGLSGLLKTVQEAGFAARQSSGSFFSHASAYLAGVNGCPTARAVRTAIDVVRVAPTTTFGPELLKKLNAKDLLAPWHMPSCPSADWSFANYHSLNFFTASTVGHDTVMLYPNVEGGPAHAGYVTGAYALSGAFTFDFSLNPRYQPDQTGGSFRAGTIFHMSSSYALSLVSGSARDQNGRVTGFRLQLQLSHSADISPSAAKAGTYPNDLVFLSDDNALRHNAWHRCVVRWGTQAINSGTGSFVVDGVPCGTFVVPSGTTAPRTFTRAENPAFLAVGNYIDGPNSGSSAQASLFGPTASSAFGVRRRWASDPSALSIIVDHPLNAELHDLSIWRSYRSDMDLASSGSIAPDSLTSDVAFYVPPFFRQSSPVRRAQGGGVGGIAISPYVSCDGTTEDPANALMALSVAGHSVNIENFVRDLAGDVDPYVIGAFVDHALSTPGGVRTANDVLYGNERSCRRNLLVMPCDDGSWVPNFELIGACLTGSRHADSHGRHDSSLISLDGLMTPTSLLLGAVSDDGTDSQETMMTSMLGITPSAYGAAPGPVLSAKFSSITAAIDDGSYVPAMHRSVPTFVYQRTQDASANAVLFDVSNIFYGTRILPGTLVLSEQSMTGSGGAFGITLRDDGQGGIHRADSSSPWATWASVGTVFYEEGLIVIRSPLLALFGKDGFTVSFKGERPVHVTRIDVLAPANQLNSSSNPAYVALPPSGYPNDPDKSFVYVTGINFHDENMNVVARTQLAQPIMKRHGDRIAFRVKIDW